MINQLSILIPTYNHVCVELVKSLQAQAAALPDFEYEILVADDGSTDRFTIYENREIRSLPYCRYIERENNKGRAAIRNYLAEQALYPWLLFIDCNMQVIHPQYLATYRDAEEYDVIYGGYQIKKEDEKFQCNLRYIFENIATQNADYKKRQANPYRDFHTSNFMVKQKIMLQYPLDHRFKTYGYEDVLWGKTLKENHISIQHIDNTLGYENWMGNLAFLNKTEESLHTLYQFRNELKGYSKIITYAEKAKQWHLHTICKKLYPLISLPIKAKLTGNKPSIFLFNIYKLLYYIHLEQ